MGLAKHHAAIIGIIAVAVFGIAPLAFAAPLTLQQIPRANHQLWDQGGDITELQHLLNLTGFSVAATGYGSLGRETTVFGPLTYAALVRFQAASGLPATGYYGPLTRAEFEQLASSSNAPNPPTGSSSSVATTAVAASQPNIAGAVASSSNAAATSSPCGTPGVLSCIPGTSVIQPINLGSGYTPGFGGGGNSAPADTTAPTASLDAPADGATVSGSVALSATAADNVGVVSVQFQVDGANVGSAITSSPYSTTWDSTGVVDGSHTIDVVAKDAAGNTTTSASITVTVDNTPPAISSIATSTTGTTATITWTTDEAASSTVNYGSTSSYGIASTSATLATSHSITLTGLTTGTTYHFQVASADAAGNVATSSDETFTAAFVASCSQSSSFLARTSGLDLTHEQAYDNLICGLVAEGVWPKLDALYMLAAADTTSADTNLVSSSYGLTAHTAEYFVPNMGYTGSGSGYFSTGFVPSTAGGHFTLNSGSVGAYALNPRQVGANTALLGAQAVSPSSGYATDIIPWSASNSTYGELNANTAATTPTASSISGFWVNSRISSTGSSLYRNGGLYNAFSQTPNGLANQEVLIGANNGNGGPSLYSLDQIAAAFIGGGLTSADDAAFNGLVHAYLRMIGLTPPYNNFYFAPKTNTSNIIITGTNDGIRFNYGPMTPVCSDGNAVITPAVLNNNGFIWMATQINPLVGSQQTYLDLWKIALDGSTCTHVTQIDFSSVTGTGASAAVWSAKWFVDPADGSIHLFAAASTNSTTFTVYETHPTDLTGFTAWSAPVAITGTSLPANMVDPFVMKVGSTYNMLVNDGTTNYIDLLTSSSLLSGWVVTKSGDWAGWGAKVEASFVQTIGSNYHILLDAQGKGIYYSDAPVSGGLGGTWSAKALVSAPFTPIHGMMIEAPSGYSYP